MHQIASFSQRQIYLGTFCHPGTLTLRAECQSARMSKLQCQKLQMTT